jgi:hypothetical protein
MKIRFATQSSVFWLMRSKAGCYITCNATNFASCGIAFSQEERQAASGNANAGFHFFALSSFLP